MPRYSGAFGPRAAETENCVLTSHDDAGPQCPRSRDQLIVLFKACDNTKRTPEVKLSTRLTMEKMDDGRFPKLIAFDLE